MENSVEEGVLVDNVEIKSGLHKTWLFIIPIIIVAAVLVLVRSTTPKSQTQSQVEGLQVTNMQNEELKIEDLKAGTGDEAVAGKTIAVHYSGTLTDGTKFDSSYDRNQPFVFSLGAGDVIPGWDKGLVGMKVGGKRKLTIPSSMAYGERGAPPVIGPNATLVFEVELLKVE